MSHDTYIQEAIKKIDAAVLQSTIAQNENACTNLRLAIDILRNCKEQEAIELLQAAEKKLSQLEGRFID